MNQEFDSFLAIIMMKYFRFRCDFCFLNVIKIYLSVCKGFFHLFLFWKKLEIKRFLLSIQFLVFFKEVSENFCTLLIYFTSVIYSMMFLVYIFLFVSLEFPQPHPLVLLYTIKAIIFSSFKRSLLYATWLSTQITLLFAFLCTISITQCTWKNWT